MGSRHDHGVAWRSRRGSAGRSLALAAGLVLAVVATAGAFVTDDARYLRLAVLGAAWAFVAAALVAGRLRREQHAAAEREQELRRAYERDLDLEAAARREFEADLESDLRRRAEEAMRREIGALRRDLAELARVRGELAQVGELRAELATLAGVRAELAGLRGDVAALAALRDGLDRLGELHTELARLRADVAEQLGGGMLVERIVMRAQGGLRPAEPVLDPDELPASARSRHAAAASALAAISEAPAEHPRPVPYRRRTDDAGPRWPVDPAEALTTEHRPPPPPPLPPATEPAPSRPAAADGYVRVAEILAENGVSPTGAPRRRRRYRDEGEPDDVLARVLGR
jgi:hypothetical protein